MISTPSRTNISYFSSFFLLLFWTQFSIAQTNPTTHNLSSSDFSLNAVSAGTAYPTSVQGWLTSANNITTPELVAPSGDASLNGTSGGSGTISNSTTAGFTFISSGSGNGRRIGSLCVALNTSNRQAITLRWSVKDYIGGGTNQNMGLSLQYRIGTTGDFVDMGTPSRFISTGSTTSNQTFTNIVLPDNCNNRSVVQVRWIYYQITNATSTRDPLQLDEINISSTVLPNCSGTPTPGNTLASNTAVNSGSNVNLSLQNATSGLQVTYQWQQSTDSIAWTNISGATSATYTASVTARTYYRCAVTCQSTSTGISSPVLIHINCSGTPAPGNTLASATSIVSGGSTNLSLQNNPAVVGLTYQWQSSPNNTTWTNISGANASTLTQTGITATTFFRCQVSCGGNTANSNSIQVSVNCSGTPNPRNTIASSNPVNSGSNVSLSLQNNTTGSGVSYQWQQSTDSIAWTNISGATSATFTASVSARTYYRCAVTCQSTSTGISNPVLININCSGTPTPGNTLASATIIVSGGSSNLSLQNNPAVVGLTYQWQSSPNNSTWTNITGANASTLTRTGITASTWFRCQVACGGNSANSNAVQVVVSTCTGTPNPGNTIANPTQVLFGANAALSLQNVTVGTGVSYQWQQAVDSVNWTNITGATGATSTRAVTANIYFRALVTCFTSGASRFSNPVFVRSLLCTPSSTTPATYHIRQVSFRGVIRDASNSSTFSSTSAGYEDFTGLPNRCQQAKGSGVTVSIENNGQTAMLKAWVDWNKNNGFEASELIYSSNGIGVRSTTFGFVVPLNIQPGQYRIRIRSLFRQVTSDTAYGACGNLAFGDAEDYLMDVAENCPAAISSVTNAVACAGTPVTLNATATSGSTSFRWYANNTDANPIAITDVPSLLTPLINQSQTYYLSAGNANCESMERTPIRAIYSKVPEMRFTPFDPAMCGERTVLRLDATGDIEQGFLLTESFENGLGSFTVANLITNTNALRDSTQWRIKTSTYVPNFTSVWRPAIASGLGANNFVFATSDIATANISTVLTSAVLNTTSFNNLFLDFSLYYSHYLPDDSTTIEDSLNVEVSLNGGTTWSVVKSYIADQGIGTRFDDKTLDLSAFINQANFRFRFKYRGRWADGAALDDIRLYGDRPLTSTYAWSPISGNNLFVDSACTIPYLGGSTTTIYFKPTPAQLDTGGVFTFTAVATLSNGCSTSADVSVTVNPNLWTGAIDNDWNNPGNWCAGFVPTNITKVDIPLNVPRFPIVNQPVDAKSVRVLTGAQLTVAENAVLRVPGIFENRGVLDIRGKIELNGTTLQQFPGKSGSITRLASLEVNNSGGGVQLNRNIFIENELIPTRGILSLDSFDITMKSTLSQTASVTQIGANAGFQYGNGRFVVERYLPLDTASTGHAKSWQLLAFPTSGGQTIKQAIQEGATLPNENPNPGFGTQVTGYVTNATDPSIGFDVYTPRGGSSIKYYNPSNGSWINIVNTANTPVYNKKGWYVFVRGDRSVTQLTGEGSLPRPATMRSRGRIYEPITNQPESSVIPAKLKETIANPYPSAVDFTKITKTGDILDRFWVWDPTLNTATNLGGFQLLSPAPGGGYLPTPGGTRNYPTGVPNSIIQSGGVFMVQAGSLNGGISFTEAAKVSGNRNMFRSTAIQPTRTSLQIQLKKTTEKGQSVVVDGIHLLVEATSDPIHSSDQAVKVMNPSENFSIKRDDAFLTLDVMSLSVTDSCQLDLQQLSVGRYRFHLMPANWESSTTVYLFDRFTGHQTRIDLTAPMDVEFDITERSGSSSSDRFVLRFVRANQPVAFLPVMLQPKSDQHQPNATSISIFPNPVKSGNDLSIQLNQPLAESSYQIRIYNVAGGLVHQSQQKLGIGSSKQKRVQLDVKLPAGGYVLELKNEDHQQSIPFLVSD